MFKRSKLNKKEIEEVLKNYELGSLTKYSIINEGKVNTSYRVKTTKK